jgi:AraC family ethanolamine operon transcriptional activator
MDPLAAMPSLSPSPDAVPFARARTEAPAAAFFAFASTDVHEYCANLKGWRLSYDQLSPGRFHGALTVVQMPRIEVFRETTSRTLRQCGTLGDGTFTLGIPWSTGPAARCNGAMVSGADTFLMSFDSEIEFFTPDDFEVRGLSASAALLETIAEELGLAWPRRRALPMIAARAHGPQVARFRSLLARVEECPQLRGDIEAGAPAARIIEDALILEALSLVTAGAPLDTGTARARKRTVDRACALMLDDGAEAKTLLDVCRAVGASPRKLAYCFRDELGVSPAQYWKVLRLNRARKALLQSAACGTDIYSVAARHGFWHFSQFSHDYKRHFMERPSDTVAKARRRPAA